MAIRTCENQVYIPPTESCNECDVFESRLTQAEQDIDALESGKQDKLTAGDNIAIEGNVISATGIDPGYRCVEATIELYNGAVTTVSNQAGTYGEIDNLPILAQTLIVIFEDESYTLYRKDQNGVPCYGDLAEQGSNPFVYDEIPFGIRYNGDDTWLLFTPEAGTYSLSMVEYDANVMTTPCFEAAVNSVTGKQDVELYRELDMSVNPWSSGECEVTGANDYLLFIIVQRHGDTPGVGEQAMLGLQNNGYVWASNISTTANTKDQYIRTFSAQTSGDTWTMRWCEELNHQAGTTHAAGSDDSIVKVIGLIPRSLSTLVAHLFVDDELSDESTNPVQNKVITETIGDIETLLAAI